MDTLTETLERILEIAEITDKEVLDSVLDVVIHFPYKQ